MEGQSAGGSRGRVQVVANFEVVLVEDCHWISPPPSCFAAPGAVYLASLGHNVYGTAKGNV
jgi:hypothetical protein